MRRTATDDTEIAAFLRERYGRLVGAVALVTGSLPAAEDAVQEACVRAWERLDRGDAIDHLDGWIATAAFNLSRSAFRRTLAERRARVKLGAPRPVPETNADRVDVHRALASLPRRQREVAVLRYLMQFTTAEVARAMGTSEGTAKSQLAKARDALAASLAIDDDHPETNHAQR
jgi:RNA polymerase sigma-70 factor, ECF subfamily